MIYPDEFEKYWKDNRDKILKRSSLLSDKVQKAITFSKWQKKHQTVELDFPKFYRRVKASYMCPFYREGKCKLESSKNHNKDCPYKGETDLCKDVQETGLR